MTLFPADNERPVTFSGFEFIYGCRMKGLVRRLALLLLLPIALGSAGVANAQQWKQTYPRLGAYEIGASFLVADPEYRERLARYDILILGMWRRWSFPDTQSGQQLSIRDVVVDIRQHASAIGNPGIKIAKYTVLNESSSKESNGASRERWDKLHSEIGPGYPVNNDWWARDKDGAHTSSFPGQWHTNITEFVRPDANGDYFTEWAVTQDYNDFFRNTPEFDMWYIDNWFWRPRVKADWNGDGTNDDKNADWVKREFLKGQVNALDRIRQLAPNIVVMGNVDGDPTVNVGMLTESAYRGRLTALFEAAMGFDHSIEEWGSWDLMMERYRTTMRNAQDNILLMTVHGRANDYATMRYGLASALMDNGYYYYTSYEGQYEDALWFDEYDVDLGRALDSPAMAPWQRGVYRRRFENGMAIVNPKGNGTRTVTIEDGYRRIDGDQDPQHNNGDRVTTLTLKERDGIILIRVDSAGDIKRPKPPVLSIGD